ncbi:hypothetical protein HELRODRAFT_188439 [Helobdella robusta]|uniref:protein-tyrosine-phosphatase n=1 Tax=Helobdella robusta TaxID=6412 RepID=T1FPZ6_HELRO|nr:hypothetical protein HELRODRAFT_188439 [Helobdella robusta]ESO06665.1 hypothetical protein HELRODRAFT_188439 [Helobdella robusta]
MRDPIEYIEIIPGRLYFYIIKDPEWTPLKNTEEYHFFCTDFVFKYVNFHEDFGPLNLACIYKYSILLDRKQKMKSMCRKKIVHYTVCNVPNDATHYKINAAFLIGTYMISHLKKNAQEVYNMLSNDGLEDYEYFRDASAGLCKYQLSLLDCLEGFEKALNVGIFDFDSFDPDYYSHYEKVENGDMNWIVPGKMMAFCSPHLCSKIDRGVTLHGPELYIEHFKKANINVVVRLNNKTYESNSFKKAGLQHHDLYFPDGSTPSVCLVEKFLKICREAEAKGVAVAVHCKAGLGRTGTLISCYLMDKYGMTAKQSIAWTRIARPGSVMGVQQNFLEKMESSLLRKEEKLSLSLSSLPSPQVDSNNDASPEKKSSTSLPPTSSPPSVAATTDTTACISDIENGLNDIALDRNKTAHVLSSLHNTSSISDSSSNSTSKSSRAGEVEDDVDDVIAAVVDGEEEERDGNVDDELGNDDDAENKTRRIKKKTQGDILNAIKIKRLRKQIDDDSMSGRSSLVRSCKAAKQSISEKSLESSHFTKLRHAAVRRVPTHLPSKKTSTSSSSLNSHLPNKRHSSSKLDASATATTCSRGRGAAGNIGGAFIVQTNTADLTSNVVGEAATVTSKVAKKSPRKSALNVVSNDSSEASTSVQTRMRKQTNMRI